MSELEQDGLRRFPTYKSVRDCYIACGGDSNRLLFSDSSQRYCWKVYFIWNGEITYCGKTNDLHRRWREHCGYKSGGGKFTSSRKRSGWRLLCTVDGFATEREALQFEDRCHQRSVGCLEVDLERQSKTAAAMSHAEIRIAYLTIMFKVLNMVKWQEDAPLAATRPLRVTWFDSRFMPNITETSYHPAYVSQRFVTEAERSYIMDFRPKEKAVVSEYKKKRRVKPTTSAKRRATDIITCREATSPAVTDLTQDELENLPLSALMDLDKMFATRSSASKKRRTSLVHTTTAKQLEV
jgi:predicted GIY-YIG superfamily endonuclease